MPEYSDLTGFEDFFKNYPVLKFEKGERVIRPRELEQNVMLVKCGILKIYSVLKTGKEVVVGYLNANRNKSIILGLTPDLNKFYMEALTPVETWDAPKKDFFDHANHSSCFCIGLSIGLTRYLLELYTQIEWLKSGDAFQKTASLICQLADDLGKTKGNITTIDMKFTHQAIASLAGLTRETVTAQINKLKKKGLIQYGNNTLKINNMAKLKAIIDIQQ